MKSRPRIQPRIAALLAACVLLAGCRAAPSPALPASRESSASAAPTNEPSGAPPVIRGYISFIINVHDWVHADESAATLLRLIDLFEKHGVRGDFYLTAPMVDAYARTRPEVLARLRESGMTVSYHVRPPHPLYEGFDQRLLGLSDAELEQTILDYETYRLDLATGDLDRSGPGGYTHVAAMLGRPPTVASILSGDPRIKRTALSVLRGMGARDDPALPRGRHRSGATF